MTTTPAVAPLSADLDKLIAQVKALPRYREHRTGIAAAPTGIYVELGGVLALIAQARAAQQAGEAAAKCAVCNGTRCVYNGPIGDPPQECEACFDQQPEDAVTPQSQVATYTAGTPRVDALMAKWDDDGATRGSAFVELRDLARELERSAHPVPAAQADRCQDHCCDPDALRVAAEHDAAQAQQAAAPAGDAEDARLLDDLACVTGTLLSHPGDEDSWKDLRRVYARAKAHIDGEAAEPPSQRQEKLHALADRIDHEKLWRRPMMYRDQLTDDQRNRLDAGVSLRRYADLLAPGRWLVLPPTGNIQFSAGSLEKVTEMAKQDQDRRAAGASAARKSAEARMDTGFGPSASVPAAGTAQPAATTAGRRKPPMFCATCGTAKVIGQDRCACGANAFSRQAPIATEHDHSEGGHHD